MKRLILNILSKSARIAILSLFYFTSMASEGHLDLSGSVLDEASRPVVGASVLIYNHSGIVAGTQTDTAGFYDLKLEGTNDTALSIRVSAIGFVSQTRAYSSSDNEVRIDFRLLSSPVFLGTVSTTARRNPVGQIKQLSSRSISAASNRSIVPTNPVSAIKGPNNLRVGSSHSSKIRVSGSSPIYQINGTSIGTDPNHYGMFSIVPGPALNQIEFYPLGTPARYSSPSVIDMQTNRSFKKHSNGEINLSPIEATGTVSIATEKLFAIGSLRKSVLDKVVRHFDVKSDRRTLPPTNFQDLFISTGYKISPAFRLYLDHLQSRDFLKYDVSAAGASSQSIITIQQTSENYSSLRLTGVFSSLMVNVSGAIKSSRELYVVQPTDSSQLDILNVNLKAGRKTGQVSAEVSVTAGNSQIRIGNRYETALDHTVSLQQRNWNFLPPDATADNPYIYQMELNKEFGSFLYNSSGVSNGTYLSWNYEGAKFEIESGIRSEYFSTLGSSHATVFRNRLTLKTESSGVFNFFAGTFAESPVSRVLDAYQVLVLDNLSELKPIKTSLLSSEYRLKGLSLGLFAKHISGIPVPTPDFSLVDADGNAGDHFLRATSVGSRRFYGGSIAVDIQHLISDRWSFSGSYGYTKSDEKFEQLTTNYELDAPHRLHSQIGYKASSNLDIAVDFSLRSGYNYTPSSYFLRTESNDRYSPEYYTNQLQLERTSRFPTNYSLNFYSDFAFGRSKLFLNIANITNRGNPVVNTAHGLVYDTGIFPSLGLQVKF